ncbi:MAG TPA: MarR family transcriptional regulator [Aeromicrobium sp.]|nr:MarR family transcriptional regulator [Aeromicrobium sp.]
MTDRTREPAYALHAVVALLDRSADQILPSLGLTYSRYLTLLTIERLGETTQRAIADAVGVTEPAVSRTIRALQDEGLVAAKAIPGTGNRRAVGLTRAGQRLVNRAADELEQAFGGLLRAAGLTSTDVLAVTDPIIKLLAEEESS